MRGGNSHRLNYSIVAQRTNVGHMGMRGHGDTEAGGARAGGGGRAGGGRGGGGGARARGGGGGGGGVKH
jgi:hypothetical protein